MIYIGSDGEAVNFTTKKSVTKQTITCSLTDTFNVHLFSNFTGITDQTCEKVVFVVPTHLPSFIIHFLKAYDHQRCIDKLFEFKKFEDRDKMVRFLENIRDTKRRNIPFL